MVYGVTWHAARQGAPIAADPIRQGGMETADTISRAKRALTGYANPVEPAFAEDDCWRNGIRFSAPLSVATMTAGTSQNCCVARPAIDHGGDGGSRTAASLKKGAAALKRFRSGTEWLDQNEVEKGSQNGWPQRNPAISRAAARMVSAVAVVSQRLKASVAFLLATIK